MRYKFDEVFQKNEDDTLTPKRTIHVNGVTFGFGIRFAKGVAFGGIDFFNFNGLDIEADDVNGVLNIRGFYNR